MFLGIAKMIVEISNALTMKSILAQKICRLREVTAIMKIIGIRMKNSPSVFATVKK